MVFSSKFLSSFLMSTIYSLLKYLRYRQKKTSSGNGENIQPRFRLPRSNPFFDLLRTMSGSWPILWEPLPYTSLAYNVTSAYLIMWWPGPQLRGGLRSWKAFSYPKKCLGHIVCIAIVFLHAMDAKFGPLSENSSPSPRCPKLVMGLLVTDSLWLLSVMSLSSVFPQSNLSGLTSNFNWRN